MAYGATAANIGGGGSYVSPHGFTEKSADEHPETLADLNAILREGRDRSVWLPKVITVPTIANAGGRMILPYSIRQPLVSRRGVGGLKVTGKCSKAFGTGIRVSPGGLLSGLTIEGPTNLGTVGSVGGTYTMFALKLSGCESVEIEDCDLSNFPQGIICVDNILASGPGLAWDSPKRIWIHHSDIHGAQAHGWGYGVLQSNANGKDLAVLVEACRFWDCRHHIACDHGGSYNYEVRECLLDDSWYWAANREGGTKYYACQIDAHGSGASTAGYAGGHYEVHHNSFSKNGNKANIGIRGIPKDRVNVYANDTAKTSHEGVYPADGSHEVKIGQLVDLEGSEGGPWGGTNDLPKYRVFAWNNWYGSADPPAPEPEPPVDTNAPDIQVVSLETSPVFVGETYAVTATVENKGTGAGSMDIVIGYMAGTVKRPLLTQAVELEAGATTTVVREAKASTAGAWTFYCGDLTAVLTVTEKPPEPPPAPKIELVGFVPSIQGNAVIVAVTVANTGNADGTALVKVGGATQSVLVPAGQSQQTTFTFDVTQQEST